MSNGRQDHPGSFEWMTLPSLGPEYDRNTNESRAGNSGNSRSNTSNGRSNNTSTNTSSSRPNGTSTNTSNSRPNNTSTNTSSSRPHDTSTNTSNSRPNDSRTSASNSSFQGQAGHWLTGTTEHPPPGLARWLNTFRQLPPAPKASPALPADEWHRKDEHVEDNCGSHVEEYKEEDKKNADKDDNGDDNGDHNGNDNEDGNKYDNENDSEYDSEDNNGDDRDKERRMIEMAEHLEGLYVELHRGCPSGTTAKEGWGQEDRTATSYRQRWFEEDVALFDELFARYFKRWLSRAGQGDCTFQAGQVQPCLSAAKTEMIYQTLVDLGGMLLGHEPLDPTHMDHLRKTIPDMIRAAGGLDATMDKPSE